MAGLGWLLVGLALLSCAEPPSDAKQKEPEVQVTPQALLTCSQVAAVSCTGTTSPLQCSAVTAVSGDYLIGHITTTNNGSASSLTIPSGWTQLGTTQVNSSTSPYLRTAVFYKAWAAAGDAQPSVTWSGSRAMLGVVSWRGCGAPSGFVANTTTTTTSVTVAANGGAQSFFSGFNNVATTNSANWTDLYNIALTGGISVGGARNTTAGATTNTKANSVFAMAVVLGPGGGGTGSIGAMCTANGDCASGFCADNRCCNSACSGGACDVCAASLGASADGACTILSAGSTGNPSCAPYVCNGSASSCPTTCSSNAQCASGYYCSGTTCVAYLANGATCSSGSQCSSGNCVDGVCCDSSCGGGSDTDCQACSVAKGSTADGVCAVVSASTVCRPAVDVCDAADYCAGPPPDLYYQDVTLNNTSSAQTDFQVRLDITSSNSSFWSHLDGGASATGHDLYFTDNSVEVPFWIERLDTTNDIAWIWLKVSIGASTSKTLRMYYGSTSRTASSSISSTMVFGDDFSASSIDDARWDSGTTVTASDATTFAIVSGELRQTNSGTTTTGRLRAATGYPLTQPIIQESSGRITVVGTGGLMSLGTQVSSASGFGVAFSSVGPNQFYIRDDGTWVDSNQNVPVGTQVRTTITATSSTNIDTTVTPIFGGSAYLSRSDNNDINNERIALGVMYDNNGSYLNQNSTFFWDWVLARKYAATPPTLSASGSEVANTGSTSCPSTDTFLSSATQCRAAGGDCGLAEFCTGSSAACPADIRDPAGTACTDDSNPCTVDQCNGTSDVCTYAAGNAGAVCRTAPGACDVQEVCTGSSTTCPTDAFRDTSYVCRGAVDVCDAIEYCTGSAATCTAPDAKLPNGTACADDGNACSLDRCDGTNNACQHPAGNAGAVCRVDNGSGCDVAETCTGASTTCPSDAGLATGTVCRAAATGCDFAETCPAPGYRKTLTFDGSQVPSTLSNFAVLVRLTDADLMARAATSGNDIYFTSGTTGPLLDFEIERYTSSTGALVAWVRIPSLASGAGNNTTIYMHYGGGGSSQANPTGVWDASTYYLWHLAQDPGPGVAGDIRDSTNRAHGTAIASMVPGDLVDAVAGKGINFNGTSGEITFSNTLTGSGAHTFSAWVNQATDADGISDTAFSIGGSTLNTNRLFYSQNQSTNNLYVGFYSNDFDVAGTSIENQGWRHVAWSYDGSNSRIYVNGALTNTIAHSSANTSGSAGKIGNGTWADRWMRGQLDEVRMDTAVRPLAWITTQYNNQRVGSTFTTAGSETIVTPNCPADIVATAGTSCRAAAGVCDVAETCNGVSGACPSDGKAAAGTSCTDDGNACSLDQCNGTADACQHPAGNAGAVCRTASLACDAAEVCTGSSTTCPTDVFAASSVECRPVAGICDLAAEFCTGMAAACPSDSFAASTVECRADAGACDPGPENCTGSSGSCPADSFSPMSTVCRSSGGACDIVENCTGSSATCPADAIEPSSTVCRPGMVCDGAEYCDGSTKNCPTDILAPPSTVCRPQAGPCDAAEYCTGSSASCPAADGYAPVGTFCGYSDGVSGSNYNAINVYTGGSPGQNAQSLNAGFTSGVLTNAGPDTTWTNALRFVSTAGTSASNQYLYWRFSNSGRTFKAGDLIEYDVYLADPAAEIGGLDVFTGAGALRDTGILDNNGVGAHPASNLVSNAYGRWYHRRYAVGPSSILVGATSTEWVIADENDTDGHAYTAYFDNVQVTGRAGECNGSNVCKVAAGWGCSQASDCATNVCSTVTLHSSIAHRWPFTSNANAVIGGQNGTVTGTPSYTGGGIVLTGGTSGPYVTIPAATMTGLTNVTFEIWYSLAAATNWTRFFDFGRADQTEYIFFTANNTGGLPRVSYKRDNGTELTIDGASALTTGMLTHAAVTVAGGSLMAFYVNGTQVGTRALTASDTLAAIGFTDNFIGKSQYTSDNELQATIYDFRIYSSALSAAEVLATYNKGLDSMTCTAQYANGIACTSGAECSSGFCVDGRCCNNACDGGDGITAEDCLGCSTAVGAPSNGTCVTLPNGAVCRASADVSCDLAETCNGSATTCPADTQ